MRGLRATRVLGFGGTAAPASTSASAADCDCASRRCAEAARDMFSFGLDGDGGLAGAERGCVKILAGRGGRGRGERAPLVIGCSVTGDVGCSPTGSRPGLLEPASERATACRFARELAVGAIRVDIVRFRADGGLFASGASAGDGLFAPEGLAPELVLEGRLMPRELTFEGPALLGLAPSEDAPVCLGSADLRRPGGAVPPSGAPLLV